MFNISPSPNFMQRQGLGNTNSSIVPTGPQAPMNRPQLPSDARTAPNPNSSMSMGARPPFLPSQMNQLGPMMGSGMAQGQGQGINVGPSPDLIRQMMMSMQQRDAMNGVAPPPNVSPMMMPNQGNMQQLDVMPQSPSMGGPMIPPQNLGSQVSNIAQGGGLGSGAQDILAALKKRQLGPNGDTSPASPSWTAMSRAKMRQ